MIVSRVFRDKKIAVLGLGVSGMAAARALHESGACIMPWDDDDERRRACLDCGISPVDLAGLDWEKEEFDYLLLSPGIPHTHPYAHPVAARAKAASCPIVCDVELLALAQKEARFIGITGTNGKSTTTALIGHILQRAGREVQTGGNLGVPALALAPLGRGGVYVLEMSSYQLELLRDTVFDIAVLLNISPDHLARHGGMEGYIAAKARIFRTGGRGGLSAVLGTDDAHSRALSARIVEQGERRVVTVSSTSCNTAKEEGVSIAPIATQNVCMDGPNLMDALDDAEAIAVMDMRRCSRLRGAHNAQNACAAYAAARLSGLTREDVRDAIYDFPGLAHRQEEVGDFHNITFINDSKATNGDACARALSSYRNIYWIAGGLAKDDGLEGVLPYLEGVRHAFLIGDSADSFARILRGHLPVTLSGTLKKATEDAFFAARESKEEAVVLLSPACASFDQFKNFMARGDAFRDIVRDICTRRRA